MNGAAPTYPFTTLAGLETRITDDDNLPGDPHPGTDNTLGTPTTWSAISYVIGGYHWKARVCDANGYIVTGSAVQYNFATDQMVSYEDNIVDKPFNCGNCHTTGWKAYDSTINPLRQDGLPGMAGTFAEQGIACESCHGAGGDHARSMLRTDITKIAVPRTTADFNDGSFGYGKAVACGECHTRDGERDYPTFVSAFDSARTGASLAVLPMGGRIKASGGLIQHHEQYDEVLGIDPATLLSTRSGAFSNAHGSCITCHDPHKTTVNHDAPGVTQPGVDPSNTKCLQCHDAARYDPSNNNRGTMRNLNCIDCHMPKMAKSAVSRSLGNGFVEGDIRSHIFTIDLSGAAQFSGSYANPWITSDFACNTCHGDEAFALPSNQVPPGFDYHPN